MEILVKLSFDEEDLGPQWMNKDNLEMLLYTKESTKRELLKVEYFDELQEDFKSISDESLSIF